MKSVLMQKVFTTDWDAWNNRSMGQVGAVTLIVIGSVTYYLLIPPVAGTGFVDTLLLIIFTLIVFFLGSTGLAMVDEYWC
ncbi:hypothetical protein [Natrarchaeobaculum sulfurireducens]|uniref:hypothetical protein n=1 Tax=Natrarchaeobaculum sulfurireducens TaxID=2044521 RepID=UPI00105AB0AF|nr:hypothetical protein [Natrarchaeobaculum sulfurireducens]